MYITNGIWRSPQNSDMISCRPGVVADADSLLELMRSFPAPTQPRDRFAFSCLKAKPSDPDSYVGVLEEDGSLSGYNSGHYHLAFYAGGKTAWVDELLIREGTVQREVAAGEQRNNSAPARGVE